MRLSPKASRLLLFLVLLGVWLRPSALAGAPRADLWSRWLAHDPESRLSVDHAVWDRFLARYVVSDHASEINRVRYGEGEDRRILETYLQELQDTAVSRLNRDEQMAYWINLYNAATVKVVLDHYPVSSITRINISPGLFSRGPWDARILAVEGEELSLNDVEHRILRPIWRDPRIHYAVNCASLGCPDLQDRAYTAANLEVLLDKGAREYVNHPRGASFQGSRLVLSSLYDWYEEDFGGSEQGVIRHLRRYAAPELDRKLAAFSGRVGYEYNWSLNEP